jgi:hypothetical protein
MLNSKTNNIERSSKKGDDLSTLEWNDLGLKGRRKQGIEVESLVHQFRSSRANCVKQSARFQLLVAG